MSAIQLNFTLRTSSKCKTVHLVGSWDGYKANVPLNKDSSKSGGWKGTFRFSTQAMTAGQRYWYYYIIDGYQVSHDPARPCTIEPTTNRKLNVLDIPHGAATSSSSGYATQTMAPGGRSRNHVTSGRSLSPSQIQHPYPSRPYETQVFRSDKFNSREMEALSRRYAAQRLGDSSSESSFDDSDDSYEIPSLSSRSSNSSSPSSVSSLGSPVSGGSPVGYAGNAAYGLGIKACTCERYAVMKDGRRFRVDCQGKVCGGAMAGGYGGYAGQTESSDCSESSSEDDRRKRSSKKKSSHSHSSSHRKGGLKIRR